MAPDEMRDDPSVVRAALRLNGMALLHASDRLREDKETVSYPDYPNDYDDYAG